MSSPGVAAEGIVVRFGARVALDGLDLVADAHGLTAVLGPNGAGKTTFLRCCTGLVKPSEGRLRILGSTPGHRSVRARVGVMPQNTGAWSGIRAGELLRYLASLSARPLDVAALIERLDIGPYARTPYRRLSGGQQQTVNLAGALVGRPELVFLDEPTAGLDPHARRRTWQLLRDLKASGVGLVVTTHAMDEAAALADHVIIVDRGRSVAQGTVADLTTGGSSLEDVFLTLTQPQATP